MASVPSHRQSAQLRITQVAQSDGVGLQAQVHAAGGQQRAEGVLWKAQPGHQCCWVDAGQCAERTGAVRTPEPITALPANQMQALYLLLSTVCCRVLSLSLRFSPSTFTPRRRSSCSVALTTCSSLGCGFLLGGGFLWEHWEDWEWSGDTDMLLFIKSSSSCLLLAS